ncbi:hypothetical protein [Sphingorhabdus sp. YGSMI21]|uniref:hypothetical protein n=1 Tax=Sphingorhabdus sp. YGSMI21 TaxID=2077182 RepID=UPI0013D974E0|nr:hypothetical protein [Sphingorhabdus sp. YGSMI21]
MGRIEFFFSLLAVVCIYSTVKGGQPERRAVIVFIVGVALSMIAAALSNLRFSQPEIGILISDMAMLAAFIGLALYAERYWTLWLCSMQVIQVLSHIPLMIIPELLPQAYYVIVAFWAYPMLIVLAMGTYRHQQRLRRYGVDRSWSDFSNLQK